MKAKLESLCPMLWTAQLKETIEFYKNILGFKINEYCEEWGWAHMSLDGVEIMFATPNAHEDLSGGPKFTGTFYITTDNVDEVWNNLKDKVKICYSIDNFDYGMRDFAIYDNNGYTLQFGTEIEK